MCCRHSSSQAVCRLPSQIQLLAAKCGPAGHAGYTSWLCSPALKGVRPIQPGCLHAPGLCRQGIWASPCQLRSPSRPRDPPWCGRCFPQSHRGVQRPSLQCLRWLSQRHAPPAMRAAKVSVPVQWYVHRIQEQESTLHVLTCMSMCLQGRGRG